MDKLLWLDRALKALVAMLLFGFLAMLAYTGELASVASSKARGFHFLVDVVMVGLLGRTGTTVLFLLFGVLAAAAILLRQDNP